MNNQLAIAFPETKEIVWQEFHDNGQLWIDGKIKIVADDEKPLFKFLTGFKGYEKQLVSRIGLWRKYFDNGQLTWTMDYGDGKHDYKSGQHYPSFRKDGTLIQL